MYFRGTKVGHIQVFSLCLLALDLEGIFLCRSHIELGGDAESQSRLEVGVLPHGVDMRVNETRQERLAGAVDGRDVGWSREAWADSFDQAVLDPDVTTGNHACAVKDPCVADDELIPRCRRFAE